MTQSLTHALWAGTPASAQAFVTAEKEAHEIRMARLKDSSVPLYERVASLSTRPKLSALTSRATASSGSDEDVEDRIGTYLLSREGSTGVIHIQGSLVDKYAWYHPIFSGALTSYEAISDALDTLCADDSIDNIVLSIDSGGGMVSGIHQMSRNIARAGAIKPIKAHTSGAMMSAAYWIGCSAGSVSASAMAEVGSIGVLLCHTSIKRMQEDCGIDVTLFRAGEYKALGHYEEALTEPARIKLQSGVDKANSFFLDHVSRSRSLSMSNRGVWAEGLTFYAGEGQQVGLVDKVEELDDILSANQPSSIPSRVRPAFAASAAQSSPSHSMQGITARSLTMNIDAQKLARIESGEPAESVLNEEELAAFNQANEEANTTSSDVSADVDPKPDDPDEDENYPAPAASANASAEIHALNRTLGKMEARLEAREERIAKLEADLAARDERVSSLMAVGREAVNKLETALGKPHTAPATAEDLLRTYGELAEERNTRFSVGQTSRSVRDKEAKSSGIPESLRRKLQSK